MRQNLREPILILVDELPLSGLEVAELLNHINAYYRHCLGGDGTIFLDGADKSDEEKQSNAEKIKKILILLVSDQSDRPERAQAFLAIILLLRDDSIFFQTCVWDYFADLKAIQATLSNTFNQAQNAAIAGIIQRAETSWRGRWFQKNAIFHRRRYFMQNAIDLQDRVLPEGNPAAQYYADEPDPYYEQHVWCSRGLSIFVIAAYATRRGTDYLAEREYKDKVFVADAQGRKNNDVYWALVNVWDIAEPFIAAIPVVGAAAPLLSPAVTAAAYHADRVNEDGVDQQIADKHVSVADELSAHAKHIFATLDLATKALLVAAAEKNIVQDEPKDRQITVDYQTAPGAAARQVAIMADHVTSVLSAVPPLSENELAKLAHLENVLAMRQRLTETRLVEINEEHAFGEEHRRHLAYGKTIIASAPLLTQTGSWISQVGTASAGVAGGIFAALAGPIGVLGAVLVIGIRMRRWYQQEVVAIKKETQKLARLDQDIKALDVQIKTAVGLAGGGAQQAGAVAGPVVPQPPVAALRAARQQLMIRRTRLQTHLHHHKKQFNRRLAGETAKAMFYTVAASFTAAIVTTCIAGAIAGGTGWALFGGAVVATCWNPIGWTLMCIGLLGLIGYGVYAGYKYSQRKEAVKQELAEHQVAEVAAGEEADEEHAPLLGHVPQPDQDHQADQGHQAEGLVPQQHLEHQPELVAPALAHPAPALALQHEPGELEREAELAADQDEEKKPLLGQGPQPGQDPDLADQLEPGALPADLLVEGGVLRRVDSNQHVAEHALVERSGSGFLAGRERRASHVAAEAGALRVIAPADGERHLPVAEL